jgi:hypothetical protein
MGCKQSTPRDMEVILELVMVRDTGCRRIFGTFAKMEKKPMWF